jgi:hypothetical protein
MANATDQIINDEKYGIVIKKNAEKNLIGNAAKGSDNYLIGYSYFHRPCFE